MKKLLLVLAALAPSCNGSSSDADPVVTPTPIDAATVGTIRGKVAFKGTPAPNPKLPVGGSPECSALHSGGVTDDIVLVKDGRLQNVFVHVKEGLEKHVFAWPKEAVAIDNAKCIYTPRVSGAQVHQPLLFTNADPTDHNIHGFMSDGQFNFTLRGKGSSQFYKIRKPQGMVKLRCDLHPWMIGWVGTAPHPFFKVTGPDGAFELKGLPPGEYTIEAWHEKYGTQTRKVKLDPKGSADADFEFAEN